jgi:hypothetical protein
MASTDESAQITLPYGKDLPISKDVDQTILNNNGNMRASIENGVVTIQTKKLKGNMREVARIDTCKVPPTITLSLEEIPE